MSKKILIVGGGGREHALAWKLYQDGEREIFIAPGNAGTSKIAENVSISADNFPALIQFAEDKDIHLTVVGPEDPLALGIVDAFKEAGLRIFGPTKKATQIESSKAFAKELMEKAAIPTASYESFSDASKALEYVRKMNSPCVVKASGLALGKGSIICPTLKDAETAINDLMVKKKLGEAGKLDDIVVFHFATKKENDNEVMTAGGRVLGVSAYADTLQEALDKAYKAVDLIHFQDMHFRKDIGQSSLR